MPASDLEIQSSPTAVPNCPFCAIAAAYSPLITPPLSSLSSGSAPIPPRAVDQPTAHVILSTPHVLAFLDHAPISRGHTLVVVRAHREKLSDVSIDEGASLGRWLGIVSRAVMGAVREKDGEEVPEEETMGMQVQEGQKDVGDWNVVQNNGARAAQVVPHVHFHIIPRVDDLTEVKARSWTVFGKGQREDLDDEEAVILAQKMRQHLHRQLQGVQQREGDAVVARMFSDSDWENRWSKL